MGFNAEAECAKLETLIKNLTTRLTTLENSIKSQAEARISSKIETLEKSITALKATDERDGETVKKLEEKMSKELQALTASLKKKTETAGGGDQKAVDKMAQENDKKISELEYKVKDAVNRKDLESFIEAKSGKVDAERKAKDDARGRQMDEIQKQNEAQNKHWADEIKQQEAMAKQMKADIMKQVDAQVAQSQYASDTAKLEGRLKALEAHIAALGNRG
jgi:hypothetical protein